MILTKTSTGITFPIPRRRWTKGDWSINLDDGHEDIGSEEETEGSNLENSDSVSTDTGAVTDRPALKANRGPEPGPAFGTRLQAKVRDSTIIEGAAILVVKC